MQTRSHDFVCWFVRRSTLFFSIEKHTTHFEENLSGTLTKQVIFSLMDTTDIYYSFITKPLIYSI